MKCKICANESLFFDRATVLRKHPVSYFRCGSCGFIQTEKPYWLPEAYAQAINRSDVGIVDRNLKLANMTRSVISRYFESNGKFIDYGGGTGLFVRLMRDAGFDFYWLDAHSENTFARGFEADPSSGNRYELLTAFEVMEHLPDPLPEIERMLKLSNSVLFSTRPVPTKTPKLDEWWYYALDHGQHVSFFTQKALAVLAKKFHRNTYSDGAYLHLLTDKKISETGFRLLSAWSKAPFAWRLVFGRKSLIPRDHETLTGMEL